MEEGDIFGHGAGRLDQESREADGLSAVLFERGQNLLGALFHPQVEDLVPVGGEDGIHEILADIVDVPPDRGQDQPSPGFSLSGTQLRLEDLRGSGQGLRGTENEGEEHLSLSEELSDSVHGGEKGVLEDIPRESALQEFLQDRLHSRLVAVDDPAGQLFVVVLLGALGFVGEGRGGLFQESVQGPHTLPAASVDEIVAHIPQRVGDSVEGEELSGVDDGGV